MTFRTIFLGIGLSAFTSTLSTIYTFKPQNASVSQLFCLIIAYVLGTAMHCKCCATCFIALVTDAFFLQLSSLDMASGAGSTPVRSTLRVSNVCEHLALRVRAHSHCRTHGYRYYGFDCVSSGSSHGSHCGTG